MPFQVERHCEGVGRGAVEVGMGGWEQEDVWWVGQRGRGLAGEGSR